MRKIILSILLLYSCSAQKSKSTILDDLLILYVLSESGKGSTMVNGAGIAQTIPTDGVWVSETMGSINEIDLFRFTTQAGALYQIRWNDQEDGDSTQTADIKITLSNASGTSLYDVWNREVFEQRDQGFSSQSGSVRMVISNKPETFFLKAECYSSYSPCRGHTYKVQVKKIGTYLPHGVWMSGQVDQLLFEDQYYTFYVFPMSASMDYSLTWDDVVEGSGLTFQDISVTAFTSSPDGVSTTGTFFSQVDHAYITPQDIHPTFIHTGGYGILFVKEKGIHTSLDPGFKIKID